MNKETKERIEKEGFEKFDDRQGYLIGGYIAGATSEHPKAWNEAIDKCIERIEVLIESSDSFFRIALHGAIIELKKLKL